MSNQKLVLDFIKHDRTLTGARNLYNSLPNKSLSFLASINRLRDTEANVKQVCYQLCKAVGVAERQMLALWGTPPVENKTPKMVVVESGNDLDPDKTSFSDRLLEFNAEEAEWNDMKSFASEISEATGKKPKGRTKVAVLEFIDTERIAEIANRSTAVPVEIKRTMKLRDQFPFLKEKDCPGVLKELVSDMMTAYEKYKAGHALLFTAMSLEGEIALANEITENFIENKQVYEELEHYKNTKQLLSLHPIFRELKIKAELEKLTGTELNKKNNSLRKNISINQKKADEAEDEDKKLQYSEAVADYTWQLEYVKILLDKI